MRFLNLLVALVVVLIIVGCAGSQPQPTTGVDTTTRHAAEDLRSELDSFAARHIEPEIEVASESAVTPTPEPEPIIEEVCLWDAEIEELYRSFRETIDGFREGNTSFALLSLMEQRVRAFLDAVGERRQEVLDLNVASERHQVRVDYCHRTKINNFVFEMLLAGIREGSESRFELEVKVDRLSLRAYEIFAAFWFLEMDIDDTLPLQ